MRKRWVVLMAAIMVASCAEKEKSPAMVKATDPEEVRAALIAMVQQSGNRWMADDLKAGRVEREGEGYRIGRWTFDTKKMTFAFEHVNRTVTPPIFFGISGVLERDSSGKLVARATGGRQN